MAGQGLSTALRIRKRRDFVRVQRGGRSVRTRHFVLLFLRREPPSEQAPSVPNVPQPTRLGLVASRRVGCAVARNRGKRLVREWFRQRCAELPKSLDLVVILRAGAPELSFGGVAAELDAVLPQLGKRAL